MFEFLKKRSQKAQPTDTQHPTGSSAHKSAAPAKKPGKMDIKIEATEPVPAKAAAAKPMASQPATPAPTTPASPQIAPSVTPAQGSGLKIEAAKKSNAPAAQPEAAAAPASGGLKIEPVEKGTPQAVAASAKAVPAKTTSTPKPAAKKPEVKEAEASKEAKKEVKKDSNVFTDLFPKKDGVKTDEKLLSSLNASTKQKNILKPKKSDDELLIYKKPTLGANLLKLAILLGLLGFAFFYSQLSPTFKALGENPVQAREATYDRVLILQSQIGKQNHEIAKLALDDYLYTADSYLHKVGLYSSSLVSQKDRATLESEFPTLRAKMREDLLIASEKLLTKSIPERLPAPFRSGKTHAQEFKGALKDMIRNDINAENSAGNAENVSFMRSISKLVDNETIKPKLSQLQIPTMTDAEFAEMSEILADSNTSGFAALASIRNDRVKWSDIIEEIEVVTKSVDQLFANQFLAGNVGEIFYSSYNLDRKNNAISITGESFSDDGKNFSVTADLIDAFEASDMFMEVEMDSFTKAKEQDNSFKGIISIELVLEDSQENTEQ